MFSGKARPQLIGGYGTRGIGLQRVIGGADLILQPAFHRTIPCHQRPQAITDHFALAGVLASTHLRPYCVCHVVGQGDAHLLGGSHARLLECSGIESYCRAKAMSRIRPLTLSWALQTLAPSLPRYAAGVSPNVRRNSPMKALAVA